MLSSEEEKFLEYWRENRNKEASPLKRFSFGLAMGLLIGVGIILNYISGWYTRATMVANSQSTPLVLILAIILIAFFYSVFYKKHKWEMNEQRYIELSVKKEKSSAGMQQDDELGSQVNS